MTPVHLIVHEQVVDHLLTYFAAVDSAAPELKDTLWTEINQPTEDRHRVPAALCLAPSLALALTQLLLAFAFALLRSRLRRL